MDKKFVIRNKNRIFHHRATENTEKENSLAGGCSPRPPKPQKKILGVLGVKPLARPLSSLCTLWLCGEKVRSSEFGVGNRKSLLYLFGKINRHHKTACFEPCLKFLLIVFLAVFLVGCSPQRNDDAIANDIPVVTTLASEAPVEYSPSQALFLMQSGDTASAISSYRRLCVDTGTDDYDTLKKMGMILLERGSSSRDVEDQLLTVYGAGVVATTEVLPILYRAAMSENLTIQLAAIHALSNLSNDYADDIINRSITSSYLATRLEATYCLATKRYYTALGQIEALMAKSPEELQYIFPELLAIEGSSRATALLRRHLTDEDETIRIEAIINAARHNRDDLLPDIRAIASDTSSLHQEACAWALGALKDDKSIGTLKTLSASPIDNVAIAAAASLHALGDDDALDIIYHHASNGNIFAITALGDIPAVENALVKILSTTSGTPRLNASVALLQLRSTKCVDSICSALINDRDTIAILPHMSPGKALTAYKVVMPPDKEKEFAYVTATSLEVRKKILAEALHLPEKTFLTIAQKIFSAKQNDLVPTLVVLLENLNTPQAISLLKQQQQHPGAPLIRDYCNLALFRLRQGETYTKNLEDWISRQQDHEIIQFQTFVPWGIHRQSLLYELTPHETSQLLIESYQALAQSHTTKGVNAILDAIAHGNTKNSYALAGLLIHSIE